MTWNLVTFAYGGSLFKRYQKYISDTVEKQGVKAFRYGLTDLKKTKTYKQKMKIRHTHISFASDAIIRRHDS